VPPKKRNLRAVNSKQASAPRATIAATRIKAAKLFQLVAQGDTLTEAGQKMTPPMTVPQVSKLYNEELARTMEGNLSLRQTRLEMELETLRQLKQRFMVDALDGNTAAARIVLGVVDRIADLCGLTDQLKIQISNSRIDEVVTSVLEMIEDGSSQVPQLLESGVLRLDTKVIDGEVVGEAG
jgi:hypothetical protein